MADDFPIILQARADTKQFERDIAAATERAGKNIKPLPLGKITGQFTEFNKSLDAATARVITFSATTGIINGVVNAFKALVKETVAVEKALADINTVLNTNQKGLEAFRGELFNIARNTAQSFKTVAEAAVELSRQGLSVTETLKRTNDAMVLSRISGLDAAQAVDTLTAAMNGFQKAALDTTTVVNSLARVDSNFAVSTKDLADALTRVGSTADDAGVSFNELLGAVTAVQQTTSRGGAVIGNAFKTIFTRLNRADTVTQLRELGVAIDESQNGIQKLQAISSAIKNVDSATANTIKELAGGVFQINVVSAALGDLSKEYSIYANAVKIAGQSTNDAIKRNEDLNKTLAALSSQSLTNIQDLLSKIGNISLGNNLKNLFASFNGITKALSESLDGESIGADLGKGVLAGLGNFLTGPAVIVVFGGLLKLATQVGKDIAASFRQTVGITTEADKQKQLQTQISSILQQNDALYGKYLNTSKGVALVQSEILGILKAQAAASQNIILASNTIAKGVSPQFTRAKTGNLVAKNAASGLIPAFAAESSAIKRGVGGASGNEKLAYIPSFNYGGGKKGPVVANTGEVVVENFLGGDASAILTKDMIEALGGEDKLGLLGDVKEFAAGFIPGFVKKTFMKGAEFIGDGAYGNVFKNESLAGVKGLPDLVFKEFKPGNDAGGTRDPIAAEYNEFKLAEKMGLPVAKVFGSLSRSKKRGGIFKERVDGPHGDDFLDILNSGERREFSFSLRKMFNDKGLDAGDLHGGNYKVQDDIGELKKVYQSEGYEATKARALSKVKFFDGFFKSSSPEASKAIKEIVASNRAEGYVPDLASAMSREVVALIKMGYPKDKAIKAVEVGKEPVLKNSKNPEGLGVYNTIQGQTSLADAFSDHKGENWKVSGKARGHVPNLALEGDDALRLQAASIKFGGIEKAIQSIDLSNIDFTTAESTINKKLKKAVEKGLDIDFSSMSRTVAKNFKDNLFKEIKEVRGPEIEEQQTVLRQQQAKAQQAREATEFRKRLVQTNTRTVSPEEFAKNQRANSIPFDDTDFDKEVQQVVAAQQKAKKSAVTNLRKLRQKNYEDAFAQATEEINKRSAFSPQTSARILKKIDTSKLTVEQRESLGLDVRQVSRAQRRQAFGGTAGIGLSIGASLASPLLFQGAQGIRNGAGNRALTGGERAGAAALETAGGAANALSFAAPFASALGPVGLAATAAAGAIFSLADALDDSDEEAARLTRTFEDMQAKNTAFVNSFSTYIQTQEKLGSLINSGGRDGDIQAVSKELTKVFATIDDEGARRDILSSNGDISKLSEAFAKAQTRVFANQSVAAAVTTAAQSKDDRTTLGVRTGNASASAVTGISRSLISALDTKKLGEFSQKLEAAKDNLTETSFVEAFEGTGVAKDQIKSIFDSLGDGVSRLSLLNSLIKESSITQELQQSIQKASDAKRAITDLNKVLGTITAIQSLDRRAGLGREANSFAVQQNAGQNQAASRFFNVGEIGQAQVSTAFQTKQVQFDAAQERERETLDLKDALSSFASENRDSLSVAANKDIADALNKFVETGQGNLGELANRALQTGVGTGENAKSFSELAQLIAASNARLSSIDDNAQTQIQILRQNLDAVKERVTLENRLNTLGGASGQIDFGSNGFDRIRNRDVNAELSTRSGVTGQFGRSEQAQGIIEFQNAFSKLEGFDARDVIPNAEQLVRDSIRESLIQGFTRIGVELDSNKLKEINSIADVSASKQFEKRELTADAIGEAVNSKFAYDRLVAGNEQGMASALTSTNVAANTSAAPKILEVLKERFGLQKEREGERLALTGLNTEKTSAETKISQLTSDSRKVVATQAKIVNKGENTYGPVFDEGVKKAVVQQMGLIENSNIPGARYRRDTESFEFARLGEGKSLEEFRKTLDDILNSTNFDRGKRFVAAGLNASGFVESASDGKNRVSEAGFAKLIERLESSGVVSVDKTGQEKIDANNAEIQRLRDSISALTPQISKLEGSIESYDKKIAATVPAATTSVPTASNAPATVIAKPSAPALIGTTQSAGLAAEFVKVSESAKQVTESLNQTTTSLDGFTSNVAELNRFGNNSQVVANLKTADKAVELGGGKNRNLDRAQSQAQADLLRVAQSQQFNLGQINPALQGDVNAVRDDKSVQAKLGELNADASFQGLIDDANDAFVSGFASDAEMKKVGIRISQGLNEYVDSQVKLGVDQKDAEADAKRLRDKYQEQLNKLKINIPKSELGQFGQGFSARISELKQDFNDVGQLGAQTADSLVDGFGDAFVDIISGAQDAETATRQLLSSIAADLAKFYAKKALTTAITAGVSAAGYNQGGVVKRAAGGAIGKVPAVVMGGEYKFGPDVVKAYGKDFFKDLNAGKIEAPKYATGGVMNANGSGMISGGSGNKDDIFSQFDEGSFILRKSAVKKYGKNYLDQIAAGGASGYNKGGKVQKAFWGALIGQIIGGAVQGAAVGAVTAEVSGGDWKKGAMYGAIGGGIAGGIGGVGYANSNPNAGFGGGFKNSFSWTGMGQGTDGAGGNGGSLTTSSNTATGSGSTGATGTIFDNPNLVADSKINTDLSLSGANRGYASGVGNNSLSIGQTKATGVAGAKSPWYKQAGAQLAVAGAGMAASMALAPKTPKEQVRSAESWGSVTTYNTDGSVAINTGNGIKTVRPGIDFNSTAELEDIVRRSGGQARTYATGGSITSGSGRTMMRPMNTMARPQVMSGSGNKDDVYAKLKKGEFVLNDRANSMYNRNGLVDRMNRQELDPEELDRSMGIMKFNDGGPTSPESSSGGGNFSLGQKSQSPAAPTQAASGGINIEINVTIGAGGEASMTTKSEGDEKKGGQRDMNSVSGQAFAQKVKSLFMELVEQEKRPGGSLSKDNLTL